MNFGLTVNDFIGEINLDLSDANVRVNFLAIADNVIYDTLNDLLNATLYNYLINDLSAGIPVTQKYTDLVSGVTYTKLNLEVYNYEGIKRMLKYFIYDSYLEDQQTYNTAIGQAMGMNENSVILSRSDLRKRRAKIQNKAVKLYAQCVEFINNKYATYFTGSEYYYWHPKKKKFIGKIISSTYSNSYFYNRSSEGN